MDYDGVKQAVLSHIDSLFQEMEEEMALSHQGKYALLEDALENASDVDELRVAFDQWYADLADEIDFGQESDELWEQAIAGVDE